MSMRGEVLLVGLLLYSAMAGIPVPEASADEAKKTPSENDRNSSKVDPSAKADVRRRGKHPVRGAKASIQVPTPVTRVPGARDQAQLQKPDGGDRKDVPASAPESGELTSSRAAGKQDDSGTVAFTPENLKQKTSASDSGSLWHPSRRKSFRNKLERWRCEDVRQRPSRRSATSGPGPSRSHFRRRLHQPPISARRRLQPHRPLPGWGSSAPAVSYGRLRRGHADNHSDQR